MFFVQTSSNNVQEIIEGKVEKRTKGIYIFQPYKLFSADLLVKREDYLGKR